MNEKQWHCTSTGLYIVPQYLFDNWSEIQDFDVQCSLYSPIKTDPKNYKNHLPQKGGS